MGISIGEFFDKLIVLASQEVLCSMELLLYTLNYEATLFNFLQPLVKSRFLDPNILLKNLFSDILNIYTSLRTRITDITPI
jgi:hypothetical protein